jgi:hypothetical protein
MKPTLFDRTSRRREYFLASYSTLRRHLLNLLVVSVTGRSSRLRRRAGLFTQPQECEAMAGFVNGVCGKVVLGDIGFV